MVVACFYTIEYFSKYIHWSLWSFYRAGTGTLAVDKIKDTSKKSQFCHLVYYGECLYVVLLDTCITIGMIKKVIHFYGKTP